MSKKKQMEDIIKYVNEIRDDEGYAVININLPDGMVYNQFSVKKNSDISNDIYDYIDEQANIVPAHIPLRIKFHGNVPPQEQDEIKKIMKKHYIIKSYDISWDVAANLRKMIVLTIIGIAFLAAYFYFALTSDQVFVAEILSILGSFSLWEAADALLLERPHLRRERMNIEQNINQLIEFLPE